eukprot:6455158-Alexandrium_andersonii.AAC.1
MSCQRLIGTAARLNPTSPHTSAHCDQHAENSTSDQLEIEALALPGASVSYTHLTLPTICSV